MHHFSFLDQLHNQIKILFWECPDQIAVTIMYQSELILPSFVLLNFLKNVMFAFILIVSG